MQQINNESVEKYILIDSTQRSNYAYQSYGYLTKTEAHSKNYAYRINHSKYKYIKASDWK
jgi:hypothetical protein